jgi:hypothetical protein
VDEHVGCHFTEDVVPETAALNAFQIKGIREVFLNER